MSRTTVVYYGVVYYVFSGLSPQNFSLKKFLVFFPKKPCSEIVSYIFSKKSFSNFQEVELSYISGKVYSER